MQRFPNRFLIAFIFLPILTSAEILAMPATSPHETDRSRKVPGRLVKTSWSMGREESPVMLEVLCTAYDAGPCCCGRWAYYRGGGWTASGARAAVGRTIAVDPRVIPLGSRVYVEGMGEFKAEDTGSGVKGRHIDIYMATHRQAAAFPTGKRRVWVRPPAAVRQTSLGMVSF